MKRRDFLMNALCGLGWLAVAPGVSVARGGSQSGYRRLLVLVELRGGNDGLNTLVPFADPAYRALRPTIGEARDNLLPVSDSVGLHGAMRAIMSIWDAGELAVLQGVGYPTPNLSHFRSIEIWNTASKSNETCTEGWLARAFADKPPPREFVADGVRVGQGELGPLAGVGSRSIALTNIDQFLRSSRLAQGAGGSGSSALRYIMRVDQEIADAASRLHTDSRAAMAEFPKGGFGDALKTAMQVIESGSGVAAVCVALGGFDTHQRQQGVQPALLRQLAEGLVALKTALTGMGRWDDAMVLTYSEFGRRAGENKSGGTDHGTASVHFACGGRVKGGLHGAMPSLEALDAGGNLVHTLDFRSVYATVLSRGWGVNAEKVLGGRFREVDFLRA